MTASITKLKGGEISALMDVVITNFIDRKLNKTYLGQEWVAKQL